jgi:flagellar hook-basal body complex protein FliE
MVEFKILGSLMAPAGLDKAAQSSVAGPGSFAGLVKSAVQDTLAQHKEAVNLTTAVAQGQDVPSHQVIQAVTEAELTLQTMVAVRDRAVEAYNQILQMPV